MLIENVLELLCGGKGQVGFCEVVVRLDLQGEIWIYEGIDEYTTSFTTWNCAPYSKISRWNCFSKQW